jgi:hypothetical protein
MPSCASFGVRKKTVVVAQRQSPGLWFRLLRVQIPSATPGRILK